MSDRAVIAEGLGKRYRLGTGAHHYGRLTESLSNAIVYPFRKVFRRLEGSHGPKHLWALKDVSFEIGAGEAVGIIGRNGAGKTTLLKILARITEPTEGRAKLYGRVGSLLEVGTGFHPELTGRENVLLNGAILGMPRSTIKKRFDEIVAFAEVEDFVDTPTKRYSSGMQVRLAFAVAAHLEPAVLIVDEVLAVGDVAFTRKCLGKMDDVVSEGRTVLFVSHNMGTVNRLCTKGIWLDDGKIRAQGPMDDVIGEYLSVVTQDHSEYVADELQGAPGDDIIKLRGVRVRNQEGQLATYVDGRYPMYLEIEYQVLRPTPGLRTGFRLFSSDGTIVFTSRDTDGADLHQLERPAGVFRSRCTIPGKLLKSGQYSVSVSAAIPNVGVNFRVEQAISFWVEAPEISAEGSVAGVIAPHLEWAIEKADSSREEIEIESSYPPATF